MPSNQDDELREQMAQLLELPLKDIEENGFNTGKMLAIENKLVTLFHSHTHQLEQAAMLRQRAYDDRKEKERLEQLEQRVMEALPGYWLADPKYRNLAADKDHSTDYFKALGHDKAVDELRTKLKGVFNQGDSDARS